MKKIILISFFVLQACQPKNLDETEYQLATEGFAKEQADKLFVVDCLLPGQVRKLGSQMTYLSARRPIKTTAGDCEIRGGEYVAYDRSSYASALKVWLPQAESGDVEAQVMLGEIFEKGLGGMSDPALAAQWYSKAAQQGSSRAQVNLGHLYEKGLGVEQDLTKALNLYRMASGLQNTDLEFASVTEARVSESYEARLQKLQQLADNYRSQTSKLRNELSQTRKNYQSQKSRLNTLKNTLEQTRKQLKQEQGKSNQDQGKIQSLQQQLSRNEASVKQQKIKLAEMYQQSRDSAQVYMQKLASLKQQLKNSETRYQQASLTLQKAVSDLEKTSKNANTVQEKQAVEKSRADMQKQKRDLSALGGQIKQLKNDIADNSNIIESLETKVDDSIRLVQSGIEIIEPAMVLTRSVPSFQLRSITPSKKIVGKISVLEGLKQVLVNGQATAVKAGGIFESVVPIADEMNKVEVIADYQQGESRKLSFNLLRKEVEELAAPTFLADRKVVSKTYPSIDFGRFYALVIGNKDYQFLPALKTSVADAKAVEEVLRTRYGYNTTLLINADRYQIMTAFNDIRKVLKPSDNLLIYYAGHGEIDKQDDSAFWLPTDAEMTNSANWLSSHNITQLINIMPARHILVVADSCYSGAMTQSAIARLPGQMADEKRKKWLEFMVKRRARTVMTSGGVKPVLDSGGGKHSIFAKAFLDVLRNNQGLMEDYEIFRSVHGNVQRSASKVGFQQEPQYSAMSHSGHEGSPFFFVHNQN